MLNHPTLADEAQMRQEFRRMYRQIGTTGCLQVLYEMLVAGEWLSEIIKEEIDKTRGCGCGASQACDFHRGKLGRGL